MREDGINLKMEENGNKRFMSDFPKRHLQSHPIIKGCHQAFVRGRIPMTFIFKKQSVQWPTFPKLRRGAGEVLLSR